jgi:hypothetical protein
MLAEERTIKFAGSGVLQRIFVPKRDKVTRLNKTA